MLLQIHSSSVVDSDGSSLFVCPQSMRGKLNRSAAAANGSTTNPAENMSSRGSGSQKAEEEKRGWKSCTHAYQQTSVRMMDDGRRIKTQRR